MSAGMLFAHATARKDARPAKPTDQQARGWTLEILPGSRFKDW